MTARLPVVVARNPRLAQTRAQHTIAEERPYLPRVAQPSMWQSMIPRVLRERSQQPKPVKKTNPANFFIWIYLLIGSQAIRILTLKNERREDNRIADVKLRQLREVVERLGNGEDVDVEKMLGTGDETQELEWEQALRELESEERLWQNNRSKSKAERLRKAMLEAENFPASKIIAHPDAETDPVVSMKPPAAPAFY
jgi:hypothetical protein